MAAGDPGVLKRNFSATAIETTLVNSISSAATGDTTTSVSVVSTSGFPSVPYTLILGPDTNKEEVVTVTSASSTTLVIVRGQDGTQAVAHSAGTSVRHGVSGRDFKEEQTHIAARGYDTDSGILSNAGQTHVHGIVSGEGEVVGTDKAQSLTNKASITGLVSTGLTTSSATPKSYVDAILGSATAASTSAASAATSATSAATSATSAAASATAAATSATSAETSATSSAASAGLAAGSAVSSAASSSASAVSATSSAASATAAATSAASAATSASSASTSAGSAATSAAAAATTYDNFDDRYLGSKTSAPTVDNDGNTLLVGAIYWDSTLNNMYVWSGSIWVQIATTSIYTAPTLGSTTLASGTTYSTVAGLTLSGGLAAADPTTSLGLATKQYVDAIVTTINYHAPVNAATTANFASTYNNGSSGVGATLTASSTGVQTFDGVSLPLNTRVLVKSQTNDIQNGIYYVSTAGAATVAMVLTRATDSDNNPSGEMRNGDVVFCLGGAINGNKSFVNATATDPIVIGTTSITYSEFTTALPSQTGNSGKYLTTDGSVPSWAALTIDPNPNIFMLMGA